VIILILQDKKTSQNLAAHTVLITGISGFVGSYLARHLLDSGHDVTGLIVRRADNQKPKRLKDIISNVRLIYGDITELTSILSVIQEVKPDWIFHLASQSYVPQSYKDPLGTFRVNCLGTQNVLEAVRLKNLESRVVFAGTSEEYGLQFKDMDHFERIKKKYGIIEPYPKSFPELPVNEEGPLRPMSPYATSKVFGDYAFRNYHNTYNLYTVVSRAFNHEGAGRGDLFVTSSIVRQVVAMHLDEANIMKIGDVLSFRDWSHVKDIVDGYSRLAESAEAGSIYVQGSMRTNSVLSYILYTISSLGYEILKIRTANNEKIVRDPLSEATVNIGNVKLKSNTIDQMLLSNTLEYDLSDEGLIIETNKREFKVKFDPIKSRPSDVPILLSNIEKIKNLGFVPKRELIDIISDQIDYYLDPEHRNNFLLD
jgi:GDPmannose 4,6-dehydratase